MRHMVAYRLGQTVAEIECMDLSEFLTWIAFFEKIEERPPDDN